MDWAALVQNAMNKFNLEIAGGLGPTAGKVWRVSSATVVLAECVSLTPQHQLLLLLLLLLAVGVLGLRCIKPSGLVSHYSTPGRSLL